MQTEGLIVTAQIAGLGWHTIRMQRPAERRKFSEERSEIGIIAIRIAARMSIDNER